VLDSNACNRRSLPTSRGEAPWHSSSRSRAPPTSLKDEAKRVEVAGSFYVIDETRMHRGGPLSEGEVSRKKAT